MSTVCNALKLRKLKCTLNVGEKCKCRFKLLFSYSVDSRWMTLWIRNEIAGTSDRTMYRSENNTIMMWSDVFVLTLHYSCYKWRPETSNVWLNRSFPRNKTLSVQCTYAPHLSSKLYSAVLTCYLALVTGTVECSGLHEERFRLWNCDRLRSRKSAVVKCSCVIVGRP